MGVGCLAGVGAGVLAGVTTGAGVLVAFAVGVGSACCAGEGLEGCCEDDWVVKTGTWTTFGAAVGVAPTVVRSAGFEGAGGEMRPGGVTLSTRGESTVVTGAATAHEPPARRPAAPHAPVFPATTARVAVTWVAAGVSATAATAGAADALSAGVGSWTCSGVLQAGPVQWLAV